MGTTTKPVLLDSGKAVGASIGLGIVLAYMPMFSVFAVPALPIPAAYITSRYGILAGLAISLVVGAVCMALTVPLIGVYAGLLIFMLMAMAGIGAGLALRHGISQFRLFVCMVAVFLAVLFLWLGTLLLIVGKTPVGAIESLVDSTAEPTRQIYTAVGMGQEDIDSMVADFREFASSLPYLAPALLLLVSLVFSWVNLAVARRVFDWLSQPFPRDFTFRNFRVHWAIAYVFILGLLCQLLSPYAPEIYAGAVEVTGANIYLATSAIFFIQGLAVASFFLWSFKQSLGKKVAVYSVLVLLELLLSLTMWMGLFDTWIDYRRRFIRKKMRGQ